VIGNNLEALTALLLSISLATERLVVMAKTIAPTWLTDEKKTAANEIDRIGDRWRRIRVLLIAFLVAFIAATLTADVATRPFWFFKEGFPFWASYGGSDGGRIPTPLLALLASGGSAFWTGVVGLVSASRDVRVQQKAAEGLEFRTEAERRGVAPVDSGAAARGVDATPLLTEGPPEPTLNAAAIASSLSVRVP
jgi:hypothetical protein